MGTRCKFRVACVVAVAIVVTTAVPASAGVPADRDSGEVPQAELSRSAAVNLVADRIGALGEAAFREVFSGIRVDEAARSVTVHVTDVASGRSLAERALRSVSTAGVVVDVRQSRYSRRQLDAAAASIWESAGKSGIQVYSIAKRDDGAGIEVRTAAPAAAGVLASSVSALAGADVTFVRGERANAVSREDQSPPYPGGLPIRDGWSSSGWDCTAAFGVRNSSGTYLLGAEHCYGVGDDVEAMNGNDIGSVVRENNPHDGALISGQAQSGVWVNDDHMFNVRTSSNTWAGEYVCQSGYTSYPNRCQIEITHSNTEWDYQDGKGVRYGAEGRRCSGCAAVAHGDSGGPVWTIHPEGDVLARGIVSGGWGVVQEGVSYENLLFTKVDAATNALGVQLITS
jgi:hypothetical protein